MVAPANGPHVLRADPLAADSVPAVQIRGSERYQAVYLVLVRVLFLNLAVAVIKLVFGNWTSTVSIVSVWGGTLATSFSGAAGEAAGTGPWVVCFSSCSPPENKSDIRNNTRMPSEGPRTIQKIGAGFEAEGGPVFDGWSVIIRSVIL